jgi:hypothetical protein
MGGKLIFALGEKVRINYSAEKPDDSSGSSQL